MTVTLSVTEVAEKAGVPTSTVRYYERVGLIRPTGRTPGNHRIYDRAALERLLFIRAAQGAGFTLEDIGTMLDLRDGSLEPCREVQSLIETRLDAIARRMADYRRVQKTLKEGLARCRAACDPARCEVLDELTEAAGGSRER